MPSRNYSFELEITFCVRGVISPLLSNLYLNPLDHRMAERGYEMVRYADGTPVQMSNLRGESPLIPIVRSGI